MARPPKYKCDENFFESIDSHEKAYLLGFLWADGHNNPRSGLKLMIHNKDIEILNYFKEYMRCDSPIKYRDNYCIFSINRSKIYNDLLKLGMYTNKSINNLLWPIIDTIFYNSFILGLFDGDGSICRKETTFAVSFANGYNLLKLLETYLNSNNIQTNPIRYRYGVDRPQACQLDISGLENINRLKSLMYRDSKIFMSRKFNLFTDSEQKLIEFSITNNRLNGNTDKVLDMYSSGISQINISKILNIKYSTVRAIIQRDRKTNTL